MTKEHELKVWSEFYEDLASGKKPFELRRDDRGFEVGDMLWLRDFDQKTETYTGNSFRAVVTYKLLDFQGLQPGFVILGLEVEEKK